MNEKPAHPPNNGPEQKPQERPGYSFSWWKKILCGVAVLMIFAGGGLLVFSSGSAAQEGKDTSRTKGDSQGFETTFMPREGDNSGRDSFPPEDRSKQNAAFDQETQWGPALLRGGIGFLIGFGIGYALRMLVRISLVFCGFILLSMVVFSYIGWVEINWDTIQGNLHEWGSAVQNEFSNFKTFLLGTLPSAALSGLGLFAGFKKR